MKFLSSSPFTEILEHSFIFPGDLLIILSSGKTLTCHLIRIITFNNYKEPILSRCAINHLTWKVDDMLWNLATMYRHATYIRLHCFIYETQYCVSQKTCNVSRNVNNTFTTSLYWLQRLTFPDMLQVFWLTQYISENSILKKDIF